jgi:predicted enzyme related to lactoylglutathione lyase
MINGGNATIFVSDLNRAVKFYTETLELKLRYQAEDKWAEVDAGNGLVLGLHPAGPQSVTPGTRGAISIGFVVTKSLDEVVHSLTERGVTFHGPLTEDGTVRLAFFADPDGNDLYLCELPNE